MRRFLPQTIAAILVASALAWGQAFKGPDTKARGHTPIWDNGIGATFSGAPQNGQVWAFPMHNNLLFPGNFAGSQIDGYPVAKCVTTQPGEFDLYTVACNGVNFGTFSLSGTAVIVNQTTAVTSSASTTLQTPASIAGMLINDYFICALSADTGNTPSAPTMNGAATLSVSSCPANGTPIIEPGHNQQAIIFYAQATSAGTYNFNLTYPGNEDIAVTCYDVRGLQNSSVLDNCSGSVAGSTSNGVNSQTPSTGTITITNAPVLAIASMGFGGPFTVTAGPTNGFTASTTNPIASGSGSTQLSAYKAINAAGTSSYSYTTSTAASDWAAVTATFKTTSPGISAFATTNGQPVLCPAGGTATVTASNPASGVNCTYALPAHTP